LLNSRDLTGQTPLHYAVRSGSESVVAELLSFESGFKIELNAENQYGQTAFYYAAYLLHCLKRPQNVDLLDNLPMHQVCFPLLPFMMPIPPRPHKWDVPGGWSSSDRSNCTF
jgi:hypothetical protein